MELRSHQTDRRFTVTLLLCVLLLTLVFVVPKPATAMQAHSVKKTKRWSKPFLNEESKVIQTSMHDRFNDQRKKAPGKIIGLLKRLPQKFDEFYYTYIQPTWTKSGERVPFEKLVVDNKVYGTDTMYPSSYKHVDSNKYIRSKPYYRVIDEPYETNRSISEQIKHKLSPPPFSLNKYADSIGYQRVSNENVNSNDYYSGSTYFKPKDGETDSTSHVLQKAGAPPVVMPQEMRWNQFKSHFSYWSKATFLPIVGGLVALAETS